MYSHITKLQVSQNLFRSPEIYDARNNQKKVEFPEVTEISNFSCNNSELFVTWKDGHASKYNIGELETNFNPKDTDSRIKEITWHASTFPNTEGMYKEK